jgi:hypothetical protein
MRKAGDTHTLEESQSCISQERIRIAGDDFDSVVYCRTLSVPIRDMIIFSRGDTAHIVHRKPRC